MLVHWARRSDPAVHTAGNDRYQQINGTAHPPPPARHCTCKRACKWGVQREPSIRSCQRALCSTGGFLWPTFTSAVGPSPSSLSSGHTSSGTRKKASSPPPLHGTTYSMKAASLASRFHTRSALPSHCNVGKGGREEGAWRGGTITVGGKQARDGFFASQPAQFAIRTTKRCGSRMSLLKGFEPQQIRRDCKRTPPQTTAPAHRSNNRPELSGGAKCVPWKCACFSGWICPLQHAQRSQTYTPVFPWLTYSEHCLAN